MIKRFLSLSVLIAILWGCCNVEDTPSTAEKSDSPEPTYTVIYKSDYGTVPSKITGLKKGDTLTEAQLAGITTVGYTFAGWYNGENEITTEYKISSDLNLTAKWNVNTYTVKFNANGGNGEMTDMSFNYDEEKALTKNTFTRKDYTFAGWAVKADGNATYADMAKVKNLTAEDKATVTLYAVWTENDKVLPVIFSQPTAVDYGESITLSCKTEGAKISYTIDGVTAEYTDAITITKDVTITAFATKDGMKDSDESTASYIVKTYTVTYKSDYDTAPSDVAGLKKGDTLTAEQLPELTRTGYTFAGWYNGETKVDAGHVVISNLELTAQWDVNTYTITYELNGGTNASSNPTSYTVETDTITLANATKKGYTFLGWYDENGDKVTHVPSGTTKSISVTAKWWDSTGFVYVEGATINGAITADGYTTSSIFKDSGTVTVGNFYMSDHEVTQAEYEKYCGYGGSKPSNSNGVGINYPAYYVSWFDALVYCNKRSKAEGLTPCYTINGSTNPTDWGSIPNSSSHENWDSWWAVTCDFTKNGYRLPTEAEWEYAARGGNGLTGTQYKYAGSDTIDDVAWYTGNSNSKTHTVKGKEPNGLGLYDMSGNVWEWCWYADSASTRRLRGGSWYHSADNCTVSYWSGISAYYRDSSGGFRVVRTAE